MHNETQINLAQHRLEIAEEKLKASKLLLSGNLYKDSIGRSYYAIFSATRAVLALESKTVLPSNASIYRKRNQILMGLWNGYAVRICSS